MLAKMRKHLSLCAIGGVWVILAITLLIAKLFPSPYGADLRKITKLIFAGVCIAAVAMIVMLVIRARKNKRLLKIATFFLSILLLLVIAVNYLLMPAHIVLGLVGSVMDRQPKDKSAVEASAKDLTEELESEGMSSFNRIGTVWAGAHRSLLQNVLRDEWGFVGMVVTDNTMSGAYMDADQAIFAGNDLILSPTSHKFDSIDTATGHQHMRTACHNILYTAANSAALDVVQPGLPQWVVLAAVIDGAILTLIALGYIGATKKKKVKEHK